VGDYKKLLRIHTRSRGGMKVQTRPTLGKKQNPNVSYMCVILSIISISKLVIQPNFSFCLCIIMVHFQGGRTPGNYDRMWIFEFHSLTFTFHNAVNPRGEQPSIVVRALQYIHLVVNDLGTSYITYVIYTLQDRQNQIV
jgi:hypothetical protein